jgi:hypothetical protein
MRRAFFLRGLVYRAFHEWYKGTNFPSGAKAHDFIALFGTTQVVP